LSDTSGLGDPALGLLEFSSIAMGIVAGDAMAKSSPVSSLYAGTVHPGRYLVLVGGDTAAVETAIESGGANTLVDELLLPNVHPEVIAAITTFDDTALVDGDALGIVETSTAASAIIAADAGVKAAEVALLTIRLSDDLGGKAYCVFAGTVADVEVAVERAVEASEQRGKLVGTAVIPQLHHEMRDNLSAELRFNHHLRRRNGTS
jgi:microcompartment protein CcmL/EutN